MDMFNSFLSECKYSNEDDVGSSYIADTALCFSSHSVATPIIFGLRASQTKWDDGSLSSKNEISLALELSCCSGTSLEIKTNSTFGGRNLEEQPPTEMCLDFNLNLGGMEDCKEVRNTSPSLGALDLCCMETETDTQTGTEIGTGTKYPNRDISRTENSNYWSFPCNNIALDKEAPKIDLELSLCTGATESDVTSLTLASSPIQSGVVIQASSDIVQLVDEGSTSSKWKRGPLIPPLDGFQSTHVVVIPKTTLDSANTCASKPPRKTSVKTCQFPGCEKGARGGSGRCISHGGGRRCQRPGCQKGAEGKTAFCKAHGGGRRCEHLGCTKSAEGQINLCIAHGGGRRCRFPGGCTRAARGRSGLCIRHGGGKRCKVENCTKSAEGQFGLCIAHGGGHRCQYPECTKGAQGSTNFCKAHGGGKRCTFLGCTRGAEGSTPFCKGHGGGKRCSFQGGGVCSKSVHGGTLFCVSHGGGKRCAIAGCTKSARGRTNFCVRHGGGKRCKFQGCGKSAQGRTDFCKAHGGGKRCLWGQQGSGFGGDGDGDCPCEKFARGKIGLCAAHAAQIQDKRVHGEGMVGLKMKEIMTGNTVGEEHLTVWNGLNFGGHGHCLIPMQDVLPGEKLSVGQCDGSSASASLPEGRVHGGSLMAMIIAGASVGPSGADQVAGGPSGMMSPH